VATNALTKGKLIPLERKVFLILFI
jgi:hypothetical protein